MSVAKGHKRSLGAVGLAVTASLALGACGDMAPMARTNVDGIVITERMLANVKVGMNREQVLAELGTPSTTSTIGGEAFFYISQVRKSNVAFMVPKVVDQRVVAIYFDEQGKVRRIADYGLQDGKVFDFVTRTTPSAGQERNFIQQLFRGMTLGVPGFG